MEVILTSGSGTDTANRILAERQAGAYAVDLMPTGSTTANRRMIPAGALDPFEPLLIHPEVTDKSLWFGGRYWWGDPEQKYIFIHGAEATQWTPTVWFNTDLVSQAEIEAIRVPADLFNPKWRGKVVVIPPDFGGAGGSYYSAYLNDDAGPEWIRTLLIEMEPFFSTDYRVMTDGIAQGKFHLGILIGRAGRDLQSLQDKGQTNIAELTQALSAVPELTASGSSPLMMVANRPKNPAATQLFVNWFLSREGQMAVHELSTDADQSLREDIPPGNINPSYLRQPGLEYQFPDADPVLLARFDEALKFAVDVYREAQGSGG
ncbi:MAG: extracellular solute-binding protein [Chloroflexi bacterium]|nr:extracellular solute-binding protein [Chloroflexota bacterium]